MKSNDDITVTVIAAMIVAAVTLAVTASCGGCLALPVMWLWNYLFVGESSILNYSFKALDFWHAWALVVLLGILFKSSGSSSSSK